MAWAGPGHSRTEVDRAGRILSGEEPGDLDRALVVIGNWRASHSFPLNTFQIGLRVRAKEVDPSAIVAQRIKRLSSIKFKLEKQDNMQLSRMQDIGGCRAVLNDIASVSRVRDSYLRSSMRHRLVKENDYITAPKPSGYRGIHLVYRYVSARNSTYNNLQVEVQLRTRLQHAWATAVETVGTFLQQSLKASQGSEEWLRFFVLMGSALAAREGCPPVPGAPLSTTDLLGELRERAKSLDVEARLSAYHSTIRLLNVPPMRGAKYFLLELRPTEGQVRVQAFLTGGLGEATDRYLEVERNLTGAGSEAVLVSVDSIEALKRAYPNYFLDTRLFIDAMNQAIS